MFDLDDDEGEDIDTKEKLINDNDNDKDLNINNTLSLSNYSSNEVLENKEEDFNNLIDIPDVFKDLLKNYLKKNNLCMVTYPEIKDKIIMDKPNKKPKVVKINPIYRIKAALLKKVDSPRSKDFNFKFMKEQDYYFLITKEFNKNYMQPIAQESNKRRKLGSRKESKESDIKADSKKINLNFDYNKYIFKALILSDNNGKIDVFHEEVLNREICQVSHTTVDSIKYYRTTKKVKQDREFKIFEELCPNKFYIIEVEQKKPASETIIKEDGILSVLYLITSEKKTAMHVFTMTKYVLHFIDETLCNYIGKYMRDMIYDFCHLPSECFEDFLSHIGSVNQGMGTNYKLVFPLKKYIKDVDVLSKKCLVSHIYRNLPNISRPKASDKIPFHKFIFLYEKYKLYYEEKEFKIKQKYIDQIKVEKEKEEKYKKLRKKYEFLKPCVIDDPVNDKITKEKKLDLNRLITLYFKILEKYLKENLSENNQTIRDFLIPSLAKFLSQYSAFKGFLNFDIVMNEDNRFEFQCSHNKACNQNINKNMFCCVVYSLKCINCIFGFNEGFFHKHFSIMDYSYNFNEKNVIHTFLCINDSSKKNRVRVFDIPFMDKWCYQIASLLFLIYKDSFQFLSTKNKSENIDYHANFAKYFSEVHNNITEELFENYKKVIPNYFEFCYKISETPLDKYNCLDNLCQNFTNKSVYYLLKDNVIFFTPFETVFEENLNFEKLINKPRLEIILEPYLILVDKKLKIYLDKRENKEKYLSDKKLDKKKYFNKLKKINVEKTHYTVFLIEKKSSTSKSIDTSISHDNEIEDEEEQKDNSESLIQTNDENIERTNSISSSDISYQEKVIDINKVYPKKMYNVGLLSKSENHNQQQQYNFYYLLNLYYNFTYESMQELKHLFVNYDTLKRFIASIESSVTVSFSDYDKTIMGNVKGKGKDENDSSNAKVVKKDVKKDIVNCLTIMSKLTRMTRHMNCIFGQYVKNVINDILEKNKKVRDKFADEEKVQKGCDYFMKIGHYMVNFRAYRNGNDSFEEFKKCKFYQDIGKDDEPIIEEQKLIIDN